MTFLLRQKIELWDAARFSPPVKCATSSIIQLCALLRSASGTLNITDHIAHLCRAARITPLSWDRLQLERRITAQVGRLSRRNIHWNRLWPESTSPVMHKTIILKEPTPDRKERGILFVSFTDQLIRLVRHANINIIAKDFDLVVAPSWSPPHDPAILIAARLWPRPLYHLVSNFDDCVTFDRLLPNGVTIPLMASNWVHPNVFAPSATAHEKLYDIVMIANFAEYKRHFLLFKALRQLSDVRTLLIGPSMNGRTAETMLILAKRYGVSDRVTIRGRIADVTELVNCLRSASLSVILSRNEGSCVVVAESIIADTPVLLLKSARVGSSRFVNDSTGVLADERRLASSIRLALSSREHFSPRKWALSQEIDCFGSTNTLNRLLKREAQRRGELWEIDVVPHHWRPDPSYTRLSDYRRFAPLISSFYDRYGIGIEYKDCSVGE